MPTTTRIHNFSAGPAVLPVPVLDLNDVTGVAALIIKHFPRVTHELEP